MDVTQNGMSLKMEYHSKWNVTYTEMSLKMECQNGMLLKIESLSKWNVTQSGMSLKKLSHSFC